MAIEKFIKPEWTKTRDAWEKVQKFMDFNARYFDFYPLEEADRKKERVREEGLKTLKELDEMEGDCQKECKMLWHFFKGKVANILSAEEFGRDAETYLGRALKLNEQFSPAWNEMGDWAWKRGEIEEARKFFQYALDHDSDNKDALCNMSMLLRHQRPSGENDPRKLLEDSLELVKKALAVDTEDGHVYAILGNTFLAFFFNIAPSPDILRKAMDAYMKAEQDPRMKYQADLYYNQAVAMKYEEDYERCLERLERARTYDPEWGRPKLTQESLITYLDTIENFVKTKGKMKEKKLNQLIKTLKDKNPLGPYNDGLFKAPGGSSAKLELMPIAKLKQGINREKVVCGVVVCSLNTQDYVPFTFCMVDENCDCIAVTVYNFARGKGVIIGNTVAIPDPFIEVVDFKFKDKSWSYRSIRVETPLVMVVNGKKLSRLHVGSSYLTAAGIY